MGLSGTVASHGHAPCSVWKRSAARTGRGRRPSQHRSQALTQRMLDEAIAVVCMTESHRAVIQMQAGSVPRNLLLFRQFIPNVSDREIGDPYGGPIAVYESARDEMVESIPSLVEYLNKLVR